jgi:DNA-binding transcriptional regulator YdaS (Cro superfamily)
MKAEKPKRKRRRAVNMESMDPGKRAAVEAVGGIRELARRIGLSHTSVIRWDTIPVEHLFLIEEVTNISREILRPDIFRMPRPHKKK